jgi:hypothetical protein
MIWNCITCGPLKPYQVTCEEKCGACQEPITFDKDVSVPDELAEHREAKERSQRLAAINQRRAIKG